MDRANGLILVMITAGVIFFFNLGSSKLWDRDEPRNAGCAREMLERGDLVTPTFNGELRDAKPVLLYWMIISAYEMFGVNEFAARFWSAVAALGTVVCTWFIGQRLFGRQVGIVSSIVLSSCLMFDVAARAATPDSLLIFFSTASLTVFIAFAFPKTGNQDRLVFAESSKEYQEAGFPRSWTMAFGMYSLMAVGVLAKGPIAFLMPTAIIGMYLLLVTLERKPSAVVNTGIFARIAGIVLAIVRPFHPIHFLRTCWSMRLPLAIVLILVLAGPWYYLVGQATDGEFLRGFFLKEHLGRSTTAFENHAGGVWYYPVVLLIGLFPWSVFMLPMIDSAFRHGVYRDARFVFLFCWVAVQISVFTLVQTKLPSYITPCYPAFAVLIGRMLTWWSGSEAVPRPWMLKLSFTTLLISGLAISGGLLWATGQIPGINRLIVAIGLVPVLSGAILLYMIRGASGWNARAQTVMLTGAVLFSVLFFGGALVEASRYQQYSRLWAATMDEDRPLGAYGLLEPSWVFYSQRSIRELSLAGSGETSDDVPFWRKKPAAGVRDFLESGGQVITTRSRLAEIKRSSDLRLEIVGRSRYFLKPEELVMIRLKAAGVAEQKARGKQVR